MPERTCSMPACSKPHRAKGLCSTHYNRDRYEPGERHPSTTIACEMCGAEHDTSRRSGRFCSLLCRDLWRLEADVNPNPQVNAAPYSRLPVDHPAIWCGATCPLEETACCTCGLLFMHRPGPRSYCSKLCARGAAKQRRRGRKRIRRYDVFVRDDYVCWICDRRCDPAATVPHPLAATVDHLVPRVHGGDDDPSNLATAHFLCNSRRGSSWELPKPSHAA